MFMKAQIMELHILLSAIISDPNHGHLAARKERGPHGETQTGFPVLSRAASRVARSSFFSSPSFLPQLFLRTFRDLQVLPRHLYVCVV